MMYKCLRVQSCKFRIKLNVVCIQATPISYIKTFQKIYFLRLFNEACMLVCVAGVGLFHVEIALKHRSSFSLETHNLHMYYMLVSTEEYTVRTAVTSVHHWNM